MTRAAYPAWAWAVLFGLAHAYWYLGGSIARPTLPTASVDLFGAAVLVAFGVGVVAPLAAANRWGRVVPPRLLTAVLWAGCALLLVRGLAGVVDEILRVTGLAAGGLTGLSREQVTGFADPSPSVLWTGRAIDSYFVLGGLLYGVAALTHRGATRLTATRRTATPTAQGDVAAPPAAR